MLQPRTRFLAALGAFAVWVGLLLVLAITTGRRPPSEPPAERPAPHAPGPEP